MPKPTKIKYIETPEFRKDLNRLRRRFKTLEDDLETAKRNAIELRHIHDCDNRATFAIPGLCAENVEVYKVKKFACRALKGRGVKSGIRVIYAFEKRTRRVTFIEMYFKGNQEVEDRGRIQDCLQDLIDEDNGESTS